MFTIYRTNFDYTFFVCFKAMVLVYSYHPACVTLMNKYLSGGAGNTANDANGAFHDPFSSDPDAPRPYTHQVCISFCS